MGAAERRVVSVVFADLVDFTALSERLDAEDVAHIQDSWFALAAEAVTAAGGEVEKFIGDAVMATFGAAQADDTDPVRAVRAALAIAGDTVRLERSLGLQPGTVQVRLGVNTGEVVVTRSPAGWRVTGDVVNTAARLQAQAPPGQVLLGPETAFGVAHAFVVEEHGHIPLKGKARPVTAWRVAAERAEVRRGLSLHGLRAPLLGREEELAALERLLAESPEGSAAVVLLAPPGVGKSRLAEEFADVARAAGHPAWRVALGNEPERGYAVVAGLLRSAGEILWPDGDVERGAAAALEAGGYDPGHAQVLAGHVAALLDGAPLRAEPVDLYAAWTATLDAVGGPGPVWVIDDLHLADPDLRAFLAFAVHRPRRGGRTIVLTARPTAALAPVVEELGDLPVLHLEPLPPPVTRDLVVALVGEALPPAALQGVVAASGGNPLYVEELLRSWLQSGVLRKGGDGGWEVAGGAETSVPTTVHAIYQGQLDALGAGLRPVVERGSVPGVTFPGDALPALGVPEPDSPLHELTEAGLLAGPHPHADVGEAWTYRHSLLRDTAYGSLARLDRARLHVRFARWLEAHGGSPETVGGHLAAAVELLPSTVAEVDAGLPVATVAADAAVRLEAAASGHLIPSPQRAAALLERALALPVTAAPDRLRRRLALGEAERRSGRLERAMRAFAVAGDAARADGAVGPLVAAALGYESALFASRLPRATWGQRSVGLLRAADALLPEGERATRSRVLAALGQALLYGGDADTGAATCERAVRLAEDGEDDGALATALLARRSAWARPEWLPDRLADAPRIARAAEATGDLELQLEAARLHLVDVLKAEDLAAAAEVQATAEALVARLGRPLYFWYPPMWRAMRAIAVGDLAAADGLVEAFRAEGRRANYGDVDKVWLALRLRLQMDREDVAPVLAPLAEQAAEFPRHWAAGLAVVFALLGRRDEAAGHLAEAVADDFDRVPQDLSRAYILAHIAEAAALLEDADVARAVGGLLLPWAGQAVVLGSGAVYLGSGAHHVGISLRTAGDLDGAVDMLRVAVSANERAGAPRLAERSRRELDTALRLHDRTREDIA